MGNTGFFILALIIFGPAILLVSGAIFAVLKWRNGLPGGVPHVVSYASIAMCCVTVLALYDAIDSLILQPTRVQQELLGEVYGSPFALRHFQRSGFQDPGSEWTYSLALDDIERLRRKCSPDRLTEKCWLPGILDDRYYANAALDGASLLVQEGLW